MKKIYLSMALLASMAITNAAPYNLDVAQSHVGFSVSHLKLTQVDGIFKNFEGVIDYDEKKLNVLEGSVMIQSIDTQNKKRDNHLNAHDMFDSAKYPSITFKMTKFEGDKIYGDLTIKQTTKPIVLDSKITQKGDELSIEATSVIKRSEFGISWDSVFQDNAVGNDVAIKINLKAKKAS